MVSHSYVSLPEGIYMRNNIQWDPFFLSPNPMGPDFYQLRNSSPLTYRCTQIKDPRHFWGVGLSYLRYPPPLFVLFGYVSRSGLTSKNNTYTSVAAEVIISKPHKTYKSSSPTSSDSTWCQKSGAPLVG